MKKKLLSVFLIATMSFSLIACSSNTTSQTEYDMDTLGELLDQTNDLFEKDSADFSDDELVSDKAYDLYKKCSEKTGLPFNKEITVTGYKDNSFVGFELRSSDDKHDLSCSNKKGEDNLSLFVDKGEEMTVTGVLSANKNSYGILSDCQITSPENITPEFKDNVDEVINSDSFCNVIEGTVSDIVSLDAFEDVVKIANLTEYEHKDYYDDTVLYLSTDDHTIFVFYDPETLGEVKVGDKIATQGSIDSLMELEKADGTSETIWGYTGNIYEIYVFE